MTRQEVFDKVYTHFVTEGNPPSMDGQECLYRGPNGLKCAAGLFIPDELYLESMEERLPSELFHGYYEEGDNLNEVAPMATHWKKMDLRFLRDLQIAHDSAGREGHTLMWNDKLGPKMLQRNPGQYGRDFATCMKESLEQIAMAYELEINL